MTPLELDDIRNKWLNQCGACDYGMPEYGCTHPAGDYRPVMLRLVEEIDRLRGENAALVRHAVDEAARLRGELACPCGGRRWVDDENWSPDDPKEWRGERSPGDGLIPCGFCNHGGWDTDIGAALSTPSDTDTDKITDKEMT